MMVKIVPLKNKCVTRKNNRVKHLLTNQLCEILNFVFIHHKTYQYFCILKNGIERNHYLKELAVIFVRWVGFMTRNVLKGTQLSSSSMFSMARSVMYVMYDGTNLDPSTASMLRSARA